MRGEFRELINRPSYLRNKDKQQMEIYFLYNFMMLDEISFRNVLLAIYGT